MGPASASTMEASLALGRGVTERRQASNSSG